MALLAFFLFLAVPQEKPQQQPAPAAELRFAWPENISATVESERHKEQRQGKAAPKVSGVKMRYRMRVLPHAKGRLIRYDEYELLGPLASHQNKDEVSQILTALTPNLIVTGEGAFAGIEDVQALRAAMAELTAPLKRSAEGAGAGLQELTAALTSDQFLQATAALDWQALIQAWLGMPVSSETLTFEDEQPIPLFPDMTVTLKGTAKMISKGNCQRGGATVSCATFEMISSTDQKAVEALMKRILRGDKALEGVRFEHYDLKTVIRVTLETATMLPHDFSMTKGVEMIATLPNKERMEGRQSEKRTMKFTYARPGQ